MIEVRTIKEWKESRQALPQFKFRISPYRIMVERLSDGFVYELEGGAYVSSNFGSGVWKITNFHDDMIHVTLHKFGTLNCIVVEANNLL